MHTETSFNVTTTTTEHPECALPVNLLCPPAPVCDDVYLSECVIYNGPEISCAGIIPGTPVNVILQDLLQQLSQYCTTTTTTTTTAPVLEQFKIQAHNLRFLKMDYFLCTVNPFTVYWGDGASTTYPPYTYTPGSISQPFYVYSTIDYPNGYTGDIIFETIDLSNVVECSIGTDVSPAPPSTLPVNSPSNFSISISGSEFTKLDGLQYSSLKNCHFSSTVLQIPRSLIIFGSKYADVSGTTDQLPPTIRGLYLDYYNTLGGTVAQFPRTLETIEVNGDNNISGNIGDIPPPNLPSLVGLRYLTIIGNNTITGNLNTIPGGASSSNLTYFNLQGNNTVFGDIANLPCANLTLCSITGSTYVNGNLSNFNGNTDIVLIQFLGGGPLATTGNTISGDLSELTGCTLLRSVRITGESSNTATGNTITGNLSDLPSSIDDFVLSGKNTITGSLSSLSSLTALKYFVVTGDNTISGDIKDLPITTSFFGLEGNNTVNAYSASKTWPNPMYNFKLRSNIASPFALSTSDIDRLLIDLDTVSWSLYSSQGAGGVLQAKGARTLTPSPSLTAYNSLYTKIVTGLTPYGTLTITP